MRVSFGLCVLRRVRGKGAAVPDSHKMCVRQVE
jgi:hypothetical protein